MLLRVGDTGIDRLEVKLDKTRVDIIPHGVQQILARNCAKTLADEAERDHVSAHAVAKIDGDLRSRHFKGKSD